MPRHQLQDEALHWRMKAKQAKLEASYILADYATVHWDYIFWKSMATGLATIGTVTAFTFGAKFVLLAVFGILATAATVGSAMWLHYRGDEEMGVGDTQGRDHE